MVPMQRRCVDRPSGRAMQAHAASIWRIGCRGGQPVRPVSQRSPLHRRALRQIPLAGQYPALARWPRPCRTCPYGRRQNQPRTPALGGRDEMAGRAGGAGFGRCRTRLLNSWPHRLTKTGGAVTSSVNPVRSPEVRASSPTLPPCQ